jgi:hypothetical protein
MATKKILTDLHIDGEVGIGTTSPGKKLHILNDTDTAQIRLGQTGSGSYDIGVRAGDKFSIGRDNDIQEFTISAGKVGIGTTTPDAFDALADNFVINAATSAGMTISESTGSGSSNILFAATSSFANRGNISYDHNATAMTFGINATERMRIDSVGNVGIGTDTPSTPLHVKAEAPTIRLEDSTSSDNHYLTGNNGELRIQSSGYITIRPGAAVSTTFLANGSVGIGTDSPGAKLDVIGGSLGIRVKKADLSDVLRVYTQGSGVFVNNGDFHVEDNVGIGTTSPDYKLQVKGSVALDVMPTNQSEGSVRIGRYDSNTSRYNDIKSYVSSTASSNYLKFSIHGGVENATVDVMTLKGSGDVGIGTDTPGYKLDVSGSIRATSYVHANDAFVGDSIISTGNRDFAINKTTSHSILLKTAGSERMRITSSGNVGIGTTSTNAKLEVQGTDIVSASPVVVKKDKLLNLSLATSDYYGGFAEFWMGRYADVSNHAKSILTISLNDGLYNSNSNADTDVMTLQIGRASCRERVY